MNPLSTRHGQTGFTLMELLLVLILVSAISAVALPRLQSSGGSASQDLAQLSEYLRLAQLRAMAQSQSSSDDPCCWGIKLYPDYYEAIYPGNQDPEISLLRPRNAVRPRLGNGTITHSLEDASHWPLEIVFKPPLGKPAVKKDGTLGVREEPLYLTMGDRRLELIPHTGHVRIGP